MSHLRMSEEQLAARAKKLDALKQSKVAAPTTIKQKKVAVRVPTEHQEQCKVIQWCDAHPIAKHIFASQAGVRTSIRTAMKAKKEGMRKGIPDLFLPVAREPEFNGLFIEMKRVKGSVTAEQQTSWMEFLKSQGYYCAICKGADAAISTIKWYLGEE